MSHSKRNTSLAFFTNHERALLKNTWGTQSTRLSRDSFLPFGSCRLCLMKAQDPVACSGLGHSSSSSSSSSSNKAHLFCRECALNDLMQQRKEIKRLEMEAAREKDEAEDEQLARDGEAQRKEVEKFERGMQGYDDAGSENAVRGVKRKAAEELHSSATQNRDRNTSQNDASEPATSFWIPGRESINNLKPATQQPPKKLKLHPLCPGSTPTTKHNYSLKSLIPLNFTIDTDTSTRSSSSSSSSRPDNSNTNKPATAICPSCQKSLTNTSRATLATPCGHVICGSCVDRFMLPPSSSNKSELSDHSPRHDNGVDQNSTIAVNRNHHTLTQKNKSITTTTTTTNISNSPADDSRRITCYVCSTDLSPPSSSSSTHHHQPQQQKPATESSSTQTLHKTNNEDSHYKKTASPNTPFLLEISTEGTGFAGFAGGTGENGGGSSSSTMTKREGVVFQC